MVGDDSLNRAISGVRRVITETGPDLFEIETIPRTGYRLTITGGDQPGTNESETTASAQTRFTRRAAGLGAAAAAGIAAGGFGLWSSRSSDDREFNCAHRSQR